MNIFEEFKREGVTEGIEIGRAEGRVEEKTKMVKMLAKDLNLPIRQIARLVSMPARQVKTILAAI